jgi:hypothetical protein
MHLNTKVKADKKTTICHNMWKISRNACEASFQGCRRKEKASIKRKCEEGNQEREMNP